MPIITNIIQHLREQYYFLQLNILKWNLNKYDTIITLLYAHDQVLISVSEDDLQRALYTLYNTTKQFVMKMSPLESTVMAFKERFQSEAKL